MVFYVHVGTFRDLVHCWLKDGILVQRHAFIGDSRDNYIWSTTWLSTKPVVVKLIGVTCSERGDRQTTVIVTYRDVEVFTSL